jgi:hypothetical protein
VPPPGPGLSRVNTALLNTGFGRVEITYNTGQGRAPGDLSAVIKRLNLEDDLFPPGDSRNNVDTFLNPERRLGLGQYTSQTVAVNVPMTNLGFSGPVSGRTFVLFTLDIDRILRENSSGGFQTFNGPPNQPVIFEQFPANIFATSGRISSMQVFLDDAMITIQDMGPPLGEQVVFDRNLFEAVNLADDGTGTPKLLAFLADYVVFDITNVANKPTMANSVPATRVWFSGDSIALSGDDGPNPEYMEVLTQIGAPIEGLFTRPVNIPGGGTTPGTYTLRQVDPRDLSLIARITALQGIWRNYVEPDPSRSPFLDVGTFECFMFPQSGSQNKQEIAMIARNGSGQITTMYFGEVNYSSNTFSVWPIDQVDDGEASNELTGTVSALLDRNGAPTSNPSHVRSGTFTFDTGGLPPGFSASGRFIVYRL